MLEKSPSNILVQKLHAILLLKADFSTTNKIIFKIRVISLMEKCYRIPKEIVGRYRSQLSLYLALSKKLIANTLNQ